MASYLPKESNAGSAYQEGGGLYALGRLLSDFIFTLRSENLHESSVNFRAPAVRVDQAVIDIHDWSSTLIKVRTSSKLRRVGDQMGGRVATLGFRRPGKGEYRDEREALDEPLPYRGIFFGFNSFYCSSL